MQYSSFEYDLKHLSDKKSNNFCETLHKISPGWDWEIRSCSDKCLSTSISKHLYVKLSAWISDSSSYGLSCHTFRTLVNFTSYGILCQLLDYKCCLDNFRKHFYPSTYGVGFDDLCSCFDLLNLISWKNHPTTLPRINAILSTVSVNYCNQGLSPTTWWSYTWIINGSSRI